MWNLAQKALFSLDAERAHELALNQLERAANLCSPLPGDKHASQDLRLSKKVCGIEFKNPIGLAAGFDKDARCIAALSRLGFGFIEVGTLTWHPQKGNEKPRLFRLKDERALLNRMGFNNGGAKEAAARIEHARAKGRVKVPLGINIGKSKITPLDEAAQDYAKSTRVLSPLADYLVVNVSSPNTPGLRSLQEKGALLKILESVFREQQNDAPVFVKLSPDLDDDAASDLIAAIEKSGISGVIVSNTTVKKSAEAQKLGQGGVSGAPLFSRSTELLRLLSQRFKALTFIGAGGIENASQAQEKLNAGAALVQGYTGFVYEGPHYARNICAGLLETMPPTLSTDDGILEC